jgi:hypothetical protein
MGALNQAVWYIVGGLVLALAVSVSGALYFRGEANTHLAEKNAVQADLTALKKGYSALVQEQRTKVKVDVIQSAVRATNSKAVRAVRAKIAKETANENASHPHADAAQLDRLRELVTAANSSISSASKLP